MASREYLARVQQALNHIEDNLESEISLEDLAEKAGYSPGHFIWIFRNVTGQTPMEHVRQRRMTEAARSILSGDDIVDTVYRFGFSAQDAFTRSFRTAIGLPPGLLRQSGGKDGIYTTSLKLQQEEGGNKVLNYNIDCSALNSFLRVEQLLSDKVKELVSRIATETLDIKAVDPYICEELRQARVVRIEDSTILIDTAVFLEDDLIKIHDVAGQWGADLAQRIAILRDKIPEMSPGIKRLVVGYNGVDAGVFDLLISEGYAFNHRATEGRYAKAKIDFYELCDAYDQFGPYLSGGYGYHGERFGVKVIGQDQGIYRYLTAGISYPDDEQYQFTMNTSRYMTDAIGELLMGKADHPSLLKAAEAAGLIRSGKVVTPVITTDEYEIHSGIVELVRDVIKDFLNNTKSEMESFLKGTLPGKQGVTPDKLIVDVMRYVRMVTHKELYNSGFYTDSLPERGNITIFRELTAMVDAK